MNNCICINDTVVKNLSKFFKDFSKLLNSPLINVLSSTNKQDFIRKRKLPPSTLISMLISRQGKTLESDISELFSSLVPHVEDPSKQAYHQALRKMNPTVFRYILKKSAELFYSNQKNIKTLKNYIVLSEDGTNIQIPLSFQNINYYGFYPGKNCNNIFEVTKIIAKSAGIYDVFNGFFIDFLIRNATTSELPLAHIQIENARSVIPNDKKIIFLADRYYPSVELFIRLKMNNIDYCVRGKSNFFKDLVSNIDDDGWIEITLDDKWIKRFKYEDTKRYAQLNPNIKIRVVRSHYEYLDVKNKIQRCDSFYFTSIQEEDFNTDEIAELYTLRWDIETKYESLKIKHEAERVNSIFQNVIETRIYAKVIACNLAGILKKEIDFALNNTSTKKYNKFQTKETLIIDKLFKGLRFIRILKGNIKEIKKNVEEILTIGIRKRVPVRKDRHYPRYGRYITKKIVYRFSNDGRNHPKTRASKNGGMVTIRP